MTSPNKAREGVSRATLDGVGDEGFSSLPPTLGTVAGPTPELERVARAICARMMCSGPLGPIVASYGPEEVAQAVEGLWNLPGPHNDEQRGLYLDCARAALSALLPVSDGALTAMCEVGPDTNSGCFNYDNARSVFQAAINHIIGEGQ